MQEQEHDTAVVVQGGNIHSHLLDILLQPSTRTVTTRANVGCLDDFQVAPRLELETLQAQAGDWVPRHTLEIIHGPPGTGKSTLLPKIVAHLQKDGKGLTLVMAVQNQAVEVALKQFLSEDCHGRGLLVVGSEHNKRMGPEARKLTLSNQLMAIPAIKKLHNQLLEVSTDLLKDVRSKFLRRCYKTAVHDFEKRWHLEKLYLFKKTHTVFTTISEIYKLASSPHYSALALRRLDILVDEAGTVPEHIMPLLAALSPERLIL